MIVNKSLPNEEEAKLLDTKSPETFLPFLGIPLSVELNVEVEVKLSITLPKKEDTPGLFELLYIREFVSNTV